MNSIRPLVGAAYEALCVDALAPLDVLLRRRGGAGDAGIDLVGRFEASRTTVYAQCKAEARPCGPAYVRELEGAAAARDARHASPGPTGPAPALLLLSASGFTTGTARLALASPYGLALLHLTTAGVLASALPSRAMHARHPELAHALLRAAGRPLLPR